MNGLKTAILLGALTGLLAGLGYLIFGGLNGLIIFLIIAAIFNLGAFWFSDSLALRMAGAKEVSREQAPGLHAMVEEVAQLAEVPKPRVFIIQNESPNAFATGRSPKKAVVAVTTGIQRILSDRELRAVIAHEIGHVKNRDILISSIAATIAGAISYLQTFLFWGALFGGRGRGGGNLMIAFAATIIGAIAAAIIQMAISRTREYQADRSGAEYIHDPMSLASALQKLESGVQMRPMEEKAGTEATSALYIVHPFRADTLGKLFSTHPPIAERVKRLHEMAGYGIRP